MAKFKVQDSKMIRVGNSQYTPEQRAPGETEGDEIQAHQLEGGTLTAIRVENGELILEVVGRLE